MTCKPLSSFREQLYWNARDVYREWFWEQGIKVGGLQVGISPVENILELWESCSCGMPPISLCDTNTHKIHCQIESQALEIALIPIFTIVLKTSEETEWYIFSIDLGCEIY